MSVHFRRQIDRLKKMILSLGAMVEESFSNAVRAIGSGDLELARSVIESDANVDFKEIDVEEECLHTLALYQPVAMDLRFLIAVLKINNDLERIGDLAVNIAEQAPLLAHHGAAPDAMDADLPEMTELAQSMLKQSLDALVNSDAELAHGVRLSDDRVDQIHRELYGRVAKRLEAQPELSERLIPLLSVARQLERIADHAVNIAEDVIYMTRGDILRHSRPEPLKRQG